MTLRTGPSLTTLALLGGAVLALHLGLLSGGAPMGNDTPPPARASSRVTEMAAPPSTAITQVRTVSLALPASPAPATPIPVMAPRRPDRTVATPPAATLAPAVAPQPAAMAETAVLDSPPPADEPAVTGEAMASQQLAQATAMTPSAANTPPPLPSAATPPLPPSDLPPSITLPYDVVGESRGMSYRASGQLAWRLDAEGYEARMELSMLFLGSRVQTSRGGVGPEGLRPDRFADRRSSERAAHFDRGSGRIRFSNNAAAAELMPGAQDRLSLFMQLAGLLRARTHREGETITFQVAGVGDAEPWHFVVGPMETLELPAGPLQARRLTRTPRKPHDSTVEVWLAPSLGHLPVRLRVAQANGDVADQRLARMP